MKKIVILVFIACFIGGTSLYAQHGQGNGKGNGQGNGQGKNKEQKEQVDKVKDKDKDKDKGKDKVNESKPESENGNQGKGHAYGKNKDTLQGREFGQHRAAEARSKHDAVQASEANVADVTNTNQNTRDKIKEARAKLNEKKNNKKINDVDYNRNIKELDALENKVNQLDERNKAAGDKLSTQKAPVK